MRKRRVMLGVLLLAGAGVVGMLVSGALTQREPEYGGKKLSEWVLELSPRPEFDGLNADAIHEIGPKAVPYLLKWIRYSPPGWVTKLPPGLRAIIVRFKPDWGVPDKKPAARARGAMFALTVLGPKAEAAVGELSKMLADTNAAAHAVWAPMALARIGAAGLPPLLAALTNQQSTAGLRCHVVINIGRMGTNARPAVPTLQQALTASDWDLRSAATNLLRVIDPSALKGTNAP